MEFTKMQGLGNDYIYFNCLNESIENPEQLSIKLSDRHFGVGGDGIVMILPSDIADFKMRMFNADGSEGKMCGNAIRCIGKYVYDNKLTDKTDVSVETLSGIKYLKLNIENGTVATVAVNMGKPEVKLIGGRLEAEGKEYVYTDVSTGNPHCVIFCDEVANLELEKIGPKIENNPLFPDRTNVEFVRVIDKTNLEMRVWERGSGETLACGTGACATVVAATVNGYCPEGEEVSVKLLGGTLKIKYKDEITMTGPAKFVFKGEVINEN